jgi:NADH-quinone oxidoreductase subunit N
MYLDEPAAAFDRPSRAVEAVLWVSGLLVIFYFVYPAPIVAAASAAAKSLF